MGQTIGRRKPEVHSGKSGLGFAEKLIVFGMFGGIVYGAYYYFKVFKVSPAYMVSSYFGAIKSGNVKEQYELIDEKDKANFYPTLADYEKGAKQASGYNMRILDINVAEATDVKEKKPDVVVFNATVKMRGATGSKELYQASDSKNYENRMVMHKDKDGQWKVWLSKSFDNMHILEAPVNPGEN